MKLLDLFKKYNVEEVLKRLFEIYPGQEKNEKGYIVAWAEIQKTRPSNKDRKMLIIIEKRKDLVDGSIYEDVCGERGGTKDNVTWALEYSSFADWLSWSVRDYDIKRLGELTALAHILWEMTWMGFSSKHIAKEKKKMDETLKKAKKHYEKEKVKKRS